jgi:outer membrane DcaP-like protein
VTERTMRGWTTALLCGAVVAVLAVMPAAAAQSKAKPKPKPATKSLSAQLAEQKREIAAQKETIERQIAHADSQAVRIATLAARLDTLEMQLEALARRQEEMELGIEKNAPDSTLEKRLAQIEAASKKSPELPPDIVSAGDFPGSIRVPGTDAAIKFGGRIRTAAVLTLNPLGTDDRFLANSIPVGVPAVSGEDKRTNISARASRLNTEFRTPIGAQQVRAFFEGDFSGAGNAFSLRHAYAQFLGFIVGQTWSTFSDPMANHQDLDFEGVSAENLIRQPQIRYWWRPEPTTRVAFAIETPSVSLTGGRGVNLLPDVVARAVRGDEREHLQVAGVLRQIRGEATPGDVRWDWGWGLSTSGVFPFRVGELEDRIVFQVNGGAGTARYINDLESLGGMDAVFDTTTGNLHSIPAFGFYVAFEHSWKQWKTANEMNLRSTLLWSYVWVNTFDFQPPDTYWKTHRLAFNLIFSPAKRVDVGLEYIFGTRQNKDTQIGHANQIQLVALIPF